MFGRTGLAINPLCLGTGMFGRPDSDRHECIRVIHKALDAGINVIDTADVYNAGEAERLVGEAIKGRRDEVIVATKFGTVLSEFPRVGGSSRRWIMRAVEASLSRLDIDVIDVYQMHQLDDETDAEETLGALTTLVDQGKVLQIGHSNLLGSEIADLEWRARQAGGVRFTSHEPPYNLMTRHIEADVLPACRRYGLGVIAYGCLNAGWLTGRYRRGEAFPAGSRGTDPGSAHRFDQSNPNNARKFEIVAQLADIAAAAGLSLTHMAVAWTLHQPGITGVVLGARTCDQLAGLIAAADIRLGDDLLAAIDTVVPPGTDVNPMETGVSRTFSPQIAAALSNRVQSTMRTHR